MDLEKAADETMTIPYPVALNVIRGEQQSRVLDGSAGYHHDARADRAAFSRYGANTDPVDVGRPLVRYELDDVGMQ